MSKNTGTSELINYFDLGANGDVGIAGSLDINTIANATTDTDTFLVSDTGIIKYRTGAQLLSDIGAQGLLTNPVTGTGTSGTIPVFTGSTTIGNSIIQSNATQVNIVGNGSQLLFDSLGSTKNGGIQYINDFTLQISNSRGTGSSINLGDINLDFNTNVSANPKLRITAGGNVLIGTTTDSGAKLEVAGGGVLSLLLSGNTTNATRKFAFIEGKHYTNSEEPIAMIGIDSQASSSILYIGGGLTSGLNAVTNISFQTAVNNTTVTGTERMCITSVGQVGIGTSNPVRQFVISNGGAEGIEFSNVASQTYEVITFNRSTSLYTPLQFESSVYNFKRGNLLVGTTTDNGARLQVSGTATVSDTVTYSSANNRNVTGTSGATTGYIYSNFTNSGNSLYWGLENSAGNGIGWTGGPLAYSAFFGSTDNRAVHIMSNSAVRLTVTGGGSVGIGTASPASQSTGNTTGILDVSASSGGNLILHRTGSSDTALFSILKASNGTYIDSTGAATAANNAIIFRVNNNNADQTTVTTALTIASTGTATFTGDVIINSLNPIAYCNATSNNRASGIVTQENGTNKWAFGPNFGASDNSWNVYNYAAGSRYLTITSGGNVLIGTTTNPGFKLYVSGSGNVVGITSSDNTLSLGLGTSGTMSGYLGASGSALYGYSTNGGYVLLNSASAWVPASDIKRKRNFEPYTKGLSAILGLQPKLYNMDFQKDGDEKQVGLVAQEVREFIPLAYEENADFIGINYNAIIVTMVKAIQEQQVQIDKLKNS